MADRILDPSGAVLAARVTWARRGWGRGRGLLGRPRLGAGEALVLVGGRQVHTLGMRYAIDVVFCDEHWVVRHVVSCMRPQRVSRCVTRARFVVEAPCGALAGRVQRGAQLVVESY